MQTHWEFVLCHGRLDVWKKPLASEKTGAQERCMLSRGTNAVWALRCTDEPQRTPGEILSVWCCIRDCERVHTWWCVSFTGNHFNLLTLLQDTHIKHLYALKWLKLTKHVLQFEPLNKDVYKKWVLSNIISQSTIFNQVHKKHFTQTESQETLWAVWHCRGLLHRITHFVFPTYWSLSSTQKESKNGKFAAILSKSSWDM